MWSILSHTPKWLLPRAYTVLCIYNNCSSSHTDEEDFLEINGLLQNEQANCYKIGARLGLHQSLLDAIRAQTPDYAEAMNRIINNWLQKNYDIKKHGPPTWKMLADAVRAPNGGNNAALANEIARLHPATGQQVLVHYKCV